MDRKTFGWTGVSVPVIGQGTWHMGESARMRPREVESLALGIDLGLTHIDTAEMYGNGGAERVIAEVTSGRRREELFLVSKVLPEHATFGGTIRAAEQSLRRLRLEYLDLYLLHWPSHHPIEDTMRAMEALVDAGKIRFFGVSNFDLEALRVAAMHLQRHRLACNQVLYNLTHRGIDHDLVPWCRERGIAVVGYTPFGGLPRAGGNGAQALAAVAARYGKTVRQVVLRYLTREPHVFTIPKASTPEHVRDNAGAADFTLADADIAEIDRAFPAPRRGVPLATS